MRWSIRMPQNPDAAKKEPAVMKRGGGSHLKLWNPSVRGLQLLEIGEHFLAVALRTDFGVHLSDYARGIN